MRNVLVVGAALVLVLHGSPAPAAAAKPAAKEAAKSKSARDGWPETKAGERASGWVEAFSTGEDAMRAYLKESMADEMLAERGVPKRIESYRKLRERLGSLVLGSVEKSEPHKLAVSLMAEDASVHRFVFTVQAKPPHKLISVGVMEHRGHGGGHGGMGH